MRLPDDLPGTDGQICEAFNDLVTLIGEGITVDELAHHFGTIGYEVLTSLGRRYARVYKGGSAPPPIMPVTADDKPAQNPAPVSS